MEKKIEDLLKKIVEIKSIYPNELQLGEFVYDLFKKNAYKTSKQLAEGNRFNILVEKGKGKKSILLYSHLDTIGANDGWKTNPMKLAIKGDRAYGLGSWDMKGGMAVNILTFLNFNPNKMKLKLAFCVDEENISKGCHKLIGSDFIKDVECIISTEPSFFYNNNGIVTGRPGRAVYNVKIEGKPEHYAFYDKKIDINFFVSKFLESLGNLFRLVYDRKQFVFVRKITSETMGMSTPYRVNLELDSSIIPPKTNKQIKKEIQNISKKINKKFSNYFRIKVDYLKRETPFLESYEINTDNKYLKTLENSVMEITEKKAKPYFRSSVADENIFGSKGLSVFGIGATGGNAHSANEWVSLSSLNKLYQIINYFLYKLDSQLN